MIEIGMTVRLKNGKRLAKVQFINDKTRQAKERTFQDPERTAMLSKRLSGFRCWPVKDLVPHQPLLPGG